MTDTYKSAFSLMNADELLEDRAFVTHKALSSMANDQLKFGLILRNVMKHAFLCGAISTGGDVPEKDDFE